VKGRGLGWWISVLFMVDSACFAIGAVSGFASLVPTVVVGVVFFIGSICFLVASVIALLAVTDHPWRLHRGDIPWRIAFVNLVGWVLFMVAALATFVLPATDELLDASAVNSGTFLGVLCFLWGARLLLVPWPPVVADHRRIDQMG
jgi:hypothetical protein